jgi:hypothetical protein
MADDLRPEPVMQGAVSAIRCAVSRAVVDGTPVLVLAFAGRTRDGSQGTPDALRMLADATAALVAWPSGALVFDLRELSYRWGNDLSEVLSIEPTAVRSIVTGPGCHAAVASLVGGAVPVLGDLSAAIHAVAAAARERAAEEARVVIGDLLVLPILLRADLSADRAVRAAALGSIVAREHLDEAWSMRLWITGPYRLVVLSASDEDMA